MVVFKKRKAGSKKILPYKIESKSLGSSFCGYRGFAFVVYEELYYFVYPKLKTKYDSKTIKDLEKRQKYISNLSRQINLYTIWPFKRVNEGSW